MFEVGRFRDVCVLGSDQANLSLSASFLLECWMVLFVIRRAGPYVAALDSRALLSALAVCLLACLLLLLLGPDSLSWLVGYGVGRWYLVRPGVSQHGSINSDRGQSGRRYRVGARHQPPCHVSTDVLSWERKSCLVRACEGGTLVVRAPGLTVDASEKQGPLPPSPIPVTHRDNLHPAGGGGGYPFPHRKQAGLSWVPESCKMKPTCLVHIYGIVDLVMLRGVNRPQFTINPWRGRAGRRRRRPLS